MLAEARPGTASNDNLCLIRIGRSAGGWRTRLGLVTALSMVLSLAGGVFLVTSQALSEPEAVTLAMARPMVTLQIVAGLLLLATLVLVPARRLLARAIHTGEVEIDDRLVRVSEHGYLARRSFAEPLDAYRGIAHRIRTTLSGIRHELILVHPDARRDVVIALDGARADLTPADLMERLGLPEIAANDIRRARQVASARSRA